MIKFSYVSFKINAQHFLHECIYFEILFFKKKTAQEAVTQSKQLRGPLLGRNPTFEKHCFSPQSRCWIGFKGIWFFFFWMDFNGCLETDTSPPRPPALWTPFISAACIQNIPDPAGRQQGRSVCELWKCDSLETDIRCRCLLSRLASRLFPFVFASCWCELCRPPSLLLIQRDPGPARPDG